MERCPRYIRCSAPICPLDKDKDKRSGPFRGEPVCRLGKELLEKILSSVEEPNERR